MGRLAPRTARPYLSMFEMWLGFLGEGGGRFSGLSPDELVEWQRDNAGSFELLDLVQAWVTGKEGTYNYKKKCYSTIRSFFLHNRCELPRDPSFIIRGGREPARGSLTVEELGRILDASNRMYRAIFLCMFQGGMGCEELLYWSSTGLEGVRAQLWEGARYLRVDLPGRKRNRNVRPYFTFVGRDGIQALRDWLEVRPDVELQDLFVTQYGTAMTYGTLHKYWMLKLRKLGLVPLHERVSVRDEEALRLAKSRRYGKHPHELRDLFRTRWEMSPSRVAAGEYFMGHDVDPLFYNKAYKDQDFAMSQYLQAEPFLNLVSEDPTVVARVELEVVRDTTRELTEQLLLAVETISELRKRVEDLEGHEEEV